MNFLVYNPYQTFFALKTYTELYQVVKEINSAFDVKGHLQLHSLRGAGATYLPT